MTAQTKARADRYAEQAERLGLAVEITEHEFLGKTYHEVKVKAGVPRDHESVQIFVSGSTGNRTRVLAFRHKPVGESEKLKVGQIWLAFDWLEMTLRAHNSVQAAKAAREAREQEVATAVETGGEVCPDSGLITTGTGGVSAASVPGGSVCPTCGRKGLYGHYNVDDGTWRRPRHVPANTWVRCDDEACQAHDMHQSNEGGAREGWVTGYDLTSQPARPVGLL